jgi:hypothetical protein
MQREPFFAEEKEFVSKIGRGEFALALMSITGVGGKALKTTRRLLSMLGLLSEDQRELLMQWGDADLDYKEQKAVLRIPMDLRYLADTLARHEVGHALVGRSFGFKTGDIRFGVGSAGGEHMGAAQSTCDRALNVESEVVQYIEDRIVVLMAGTMAEAERQEEIGKDFDRAFAASSSDYSKVADALQLLANIRGRPFQPFYDAQYPRLRAVTASAVSRQYKLIQQVAAKLLERVEAFGVTYGWTADEFVAIIEECETRLGQPVE